MVVARFCRSEINTVSNAIVNAENCATNMPQRRKHYRFVVPPRPNATAQGWANAPIFSCRWLPCEGSHAHYHATHAIVAAKSFDLCHPDGHHGDSKSRNYMKTILRDSHQLYFAHILSNAWQKESGLNFNYTSNGVACMKSANLVCWRCSCRVSYYPGS